MEWVAPAQPSHRQPAAAGGAVHLDRLQRVGAARRVEPAARAEQRADKAPVPGQQLHEQDRRQAWPARRPPVGPARHRHCAAPPCRRVSLRITRSSSAARSAWREVAARGLARTTSRLPPGSDARYPRARCRSWRRTRLRTTAGPTARLTTNPTRAGSVVPGRTSRCPERSGWPARAPLRTAAEKSSRRRIRAAAGSIALYSRSHSHRHRALIRR